MNVHTNFFFSALFFLQATNPYGQDQKIAQNKLKAPRSLAMSQCSGAGGGAVCITYTGRAYTNSVRRVAYSNTLHSRSFGHALLHQWVINVLSHNSQYGRHRQYKCQHRISNWSHDNDCCRLANLHSSHCPASLHVLEEVHSLPRHSDAHLHTGTTHSNSLTATDVVSVSRHTKVSSGTK